MPGRPINGTLWGYISTNVFTAFRNSVQMQYQQAHVIIIVNRNSDIIDMQFSYHRYAAAVLNSQC